MKTKVSVLLIAFTFIVLNAKTQVKIFSGGATSIGSTSTPITGTKLHVFGNTVFNSSASGYSAALIRANSDYSSASTPEYTWLANDQVGLFHPANNVMGFTCNGTERMRLTTTALQINSSGDYNKCIWVNATTSNACGYHLTYNSADKFYVTAVGLVCAYYGFYTYSDLSLKENISTLTDAITKVKQLRGVSYNLKPETLSNPHDTITVLPTEPPKTQIGFIAQEIEAIVPEVVTTLHDGTKAIAYQNLIALLVEAIKEQETKIEQLQQDLNNCCTIDNKTNQKSPDNKGRNSDNGNENIENDMNSILYQNKPNPFKGSTTINYYLNGKISKAVIYIFDMQGSLLKSYDLIDRGKGSIVINGGEFNAGMYMYSLFNDGKEIDTKRMILTK